MPYVTVLNLDGKDTQAMVSPSDFTAVTSHHWILKNGYAVTRRSNRYVSMHRLVMGPPPRGQSIDHVDRNRLNNTRENLRFATAVSQARNRGSSRRKHLGLAGVVGVQPTRSGAFAARFRRKHLGTFRTIEEAAHAYDEAARQYDDAHGVEHGNYNRVDSNRRTNGHVAPAFSAIFLKNERKCQPSAAVAPTAQTHQQNDTSSFLFAAPAGRNKCTLSFLAKACPMRRQQSR